VVEYRRVASRYHSGEDVVYQVELSLHLIAAKRSSSCERLGPLREYFLSGKGGYTGGYDGSGARSQYCSRFRDATDVFGV
jgi:hypothetical protein